MRMFHSDSQYTYIITISISYFRGGSFDKSYIFRTKDSELSESDLVDVAKNLIKEFCEENDIPDNYAGVFRMRKTKKQFDIQYIGFTSVVWNIGFTSVVWKC